MISATYLSAPQNLASNTVASAGSAIHPNNAAFPFGYKVAVKQTDMHFLATKFASLLKALTRLKSKSRQIGL